MAQSDDLGVTGNAILLLGFLSAKVSPGGPYSIEEVDAAAGTAVIVNDLMQNLYQVSVVQIGGVE
ncbi:MAG TPA: hypothetical protein VF409_04730 [Sphingomonas sp.]